MKKPACFQTATIVTTRSAVSGEPRIERDVFQFRDGGHAIYYEAGVPADDAKTLVFVYGGTGCYSWKQMAPQIAMAIPQIVGKKPGPICPLFIS